MEERSEKHYFVLLHTHTHTHELHYISVSFSLFLPALSEWNQRKGKLHIVFGYSVKIKQRINFAILCSSCFLFFIHFLYFRELDKMVHDKCSSNLKSVQEQKKCMCKTTEYKQIKMFCLHHFIQCSQTICQVRKKTNRFDDANVLLLIRLRCNRRMLLIISYMAFILYVCSLFSSILLSLQSEIQTKLCG